MTPNGPKLTRRDALRISAVTGVAALAGYKPNGAGTVTGFIADMEDAASTQTFLEAATAVGDIDILINNVGASPSRNFLYMSDADWQSLH